MRPNIDIGWEIHGSVKAIADARYNGDLDLAYREVLNRGLTYSALIHHLSNTKVVPYEMIWFYLTLRRGYNLENKKCSPT